MAPQSAASIGTDDYNRLDTEPADSIVGRNKGYTGWPVKFYFVPGQYSVLSYIFNLHC